MKTNNFFLSLATLMVCATSVFISCSNDDDDNNSSKELGDKAVEELKSRLLDEEGNVAFGEANNQGYYVIGIEDQADARELVTLYAKGYTDADTYTYSIPDNRGNIRVDKSNEAGVHYNLEVRVKSIPQLDQIKLQVVDPGYMNDENVIKSFIKYICNNNACGKTFTLPVMAEKKCTFCSSTDIVKQ